ncbi:MAG: hypothetical protein IIB00_00190 [candidate division Zixibacteria bacterium]|nr:hypothetical protein [candidate division Zixibacteria bacterium]
MKTISSIRSLGRVVLLTLAVTSTSAVSGTVDVNRKNLEKQVKSAFSEHYLTHYISLRDSDLWLSIELKGKTWRNPNDTRAMVDSVVVLAGQNVPLTARAFPFKIYIDEPVSGFVVAEIDIALGGKVSLKYSHSMNRQRGIEKIYGSQPKPKRSVSSYDAILRVPNSNKALLAVTEYAYSQFTKAATRGDYDLLYRLINSGQLIETSNNVRVKFVERGIIKHKVKVLEGKNSGSVGWVAAEFIRK